MLDKTYLTLVKNWTCQHLEPHFPLGEAGEGLERKGSRVQKENFYTNVSQLRPNPFAGTQKKKKKMLDA